MDNFTRDIIHFNSQVNGKDKLCRLIQYGSKFVWWYMQQHTYSAELTEKLRVLESTLSTTRKLLRLGKSLDNLHAACKTIHLSDPVLRLTITMSRLSQALYLLVDHLLWFAQIGLVRIEHREWSRTSARFWLASIIMNISRTLYDLTSVISQEYAIVKNAADFRNDETNAYRDTPGYTTVLSYYAVLYTKVLVRCVLNYRPLVLELIRNLCDCPIPMATLGQLNVSPGLLGLVGTISSLIGILTIWKPVFKLVPA